MMLPARGYVSDHTKFIRELLEKKPEIVSIFVQRGYRTHYVFVQQQGK